MANDRPISQELINLKNQQRAALRKEYWKQVTDPHNQEGGHVFDPALQRFMSMKATKIDHFRETPKTIFTGLIFLVIPIVGTIYFFKTTREKREAEFRAGKVAYKDRLFKFV